MNKLLHGFLSALSLVSRIPLRLKAKPDYKSFSLWMPLTGLLAALAAGFGLWLGRLLFGPGLLCALSALFWQYMLFNLFHFDGLLDSADAAGLAAGDAEKRRKVLKDPHMGSFALFFGFVYLAARLFALERLVSGHQALLWGAVFLAPVTGRYAAVLVGIFAKPYAETGLAAMLGQQSAIKATVGYSAAAVLPAVFYGIQYGAIGAGAAILSGGLLALMTSAFVALWYSKNLGGYSGDAMGAAVELAELLVLLLSSAFLRTSL